MAICTPANTMPSRTTIIAIMSKWPSMMRFLDVGGRSWCHDIVRFASGKRSSGAQCTKSVADNHKHRPEHDHDTGRPGRHAQCSFAFIFAADPGVQHRLVAAPNNDAEKQN